MNQIFKSSVVGLAVVSVLSGCTTAPGRQMMELDKPQMQETVETLKEKAKQSRPGFVVRQGDSLDQALRRLGQLDGTVYILDDGFKPELTVTSQAIYEWGDLEDYLSALGYKAILSSAGANKDSEVDFIGQGGYAKVRVTRGTENFAKKVKGCNTKLSGKITFGKTVEDICSESGLDCTYTDAGAAGHSASLYSASYSGDCTGALEYMAKKADLSVQFNETTNRVEFKMIDTATIDLGIPLRDRRLVLDILASSTNTTQQNGTTNGQGTTQNTNGQTGSTGSGNFPSGKSLSTVQATNYGLSIKNVLDTMKTPFGSYNYIPETGQIFIRDRAEAVAAAKLTLNRMAQAFQNRFQVAVTLYRFTTDKNRVIEGSFTQQLNKDLAAAFSTTNPVTAVVGTITNDATASGGPKNVVRLLSQWGSVEAVERFEDTVQSGIRQSQKVANNTEYVRNIQTTVTNNVAGAITSQTEQAVATDGSFFSIEARQAEAGRIFVDAAININRLDGFDITNTASSQIKSQKAFERTFDTLSLVEEGIPYVAKMISQESKTEKAESLPGLETSGWFGTLFGGARTNTATKSYIVMVVEAHRL